MKRLLTALITLLPVALFAAPVPLAPYQHNFFTTNPAPVVDVFAGSANVTVTPSVVGTHTRRFAVAVTSGAATNLSPWSSDIDGAGYSLTNVGSVVITNDLTVGGNIRGNGILLFNGLLWVTNDATFLGTVSAEGFVGTSGAAFTGDGSALTNIPGTAITGAVPEATHATNADNATYATSASNSTNFWGLLSATNLPAVYVAPESVHATNADLATLATEASHATNADLATLATEATHATNADNATYATASLHSTNFWGLLSATNLPAVYVAPEAVHATNADLATLATEATHATNADLATLATEASHATNADLATLATVATGATNDDAGSKISTTYLKANQTITLSGDATGSGTTAITVTVTNLSQAIITNQVKCASYSDFAIPAAAAIISPTNGNLQSLLLSGATTNTLDAANTNFTETIRLNIYGSNTITWSGTISNLTVLTPSNQISVILFDHVRGTNLWQAYRLR